MPNRPSALYVLHADSGTAVCSCCPLGWFMTFLHMAGYLLELRKRPWTRWIVFGWWTSDKASCKISILLLRYTNTIKWHFCPHSARGSAWWRLNEGWAALANSGEISSHSDGMLLVSSCKHSVTSPILHKFFTARYYYVSQLPYIDLVQLLIAIATGSRETI